MLTKHVQQHRQCDLGHNKLISVYQQKTVSQIEWLPNDRKMAIIAHKENFDILYIEWLDEDDVDLSGLSGDKILL